MDDKRLFAVLTGDIIKSSALSQSVLESVREDVLGAVSSVKGWKRGLVRGKAEFFRGDAWQVLLSQPAQALRVAVFLRASLLADGKADSRVSLGIGRVKKISLQRISLSTGEAFELSGHGLDEMTQYSRMTIEVPKSAGALSGWLPVVAHLCDSLISQWTERQAEIACMAVVPDEPTHEEIAQKLSPAVTKQAVTKALDGAKWHVIREAIHRFEKTEWDLALKQEHR